MTYPMAPELLGLEPYADTGPRMPEEHDALGLWSARSLGPEPDEAEGLEPSNGEELNHGC